MAYFPTIAIGVPFFRAFDLIDPDAQAFYDRVIADGGVVPTGLIGVSATFKAVKAIYGVSDITTALAVFYDAHYLGYKLGTGTGTTLGQACTKLYSACGVSGDCVQATLASQPLLLAHNGITSNNYYYSSGNTNNNCTTPNAANNRITGDITMIWNIAMLDWTPATTEIIVSKDGTIAGSRSYNFNMQSTGRPRISFSTDGTNMTSIDCTAATGYTDNTSHFIAVERTSSDGSVRFYTSEDGVTFSQLGTTVIGASGSIFASTTAVYVASLGTGTNTLNGKIFSGKIYSGLQISGSATLRVDFTPTSYNAATSQTQFTTSTGEIYTLNTSTATTGYKSLLVDRTIVQGDGVNDNLANLTLNQLVPFSYHVAFKQFQTTAPTVSGILGRGVSRIALGVGSFSTTQNTTWIWTPNEPSTYGGNNDLDKNLNLFQSIMPSTTESDWSMKKNNANFGAVGETSATPLDGGSIYLFWSGYLGEYMNGVLNSAIISKSADTAPQQTAIYSFIKTLNNNAF
jgi:hypothetical protein